MAADAPVPVVRAAIANRLVLNLPADSDIEVKVRDVLDREIEVVADGPFRRDTYLMSWDSHGVAPGVCFLRARAGSKAAIETIVKVPR